MRSIKYFGLVSILLLVSASSFAQDISGDWYGQLDIQGINLRLVLHFSKTDRGWKGTMDSPDQNAKGIPLSAVSFKDGKLNVSIDLIKFTYEGNYRNNKIEGSLKQGPVSVQMDFQREAIAKKELKRPQEPKPPFNYNEEEVSFENAAANISLTGTFTYPKTNNNVPAVVLITGSGPQNRDEELMGHKPFAVIADYLSNRNIAVLRFDDRGTAKSKGNFATATSKDFATDVAAAVQYLKTRKEVDKQHIGLIGHSEGGLIAPMVAAEDKSIDFIILLAGTGIDGGNILLLQEKLISKANGTSQKEIDETEKTNQQIFDWVKKEKDTTVLKNKITEVIKQAIKSNPESLPKGVDETTLINKSIAEIMTPWMLYFIRYNPAEALSKLECKVLALNGEKDLQVPANENIPAIEAAFKKGGNKHFETKVFPDLNHLFQHCTTGSPNEYAEIEETFSLEVLNKMGSWINKEILGFKPNTKSESEAVFVNVEVEASFPGGVNAWAKYLERNLNAQVPSNNGAPVGKYTVIVTFIVDQDGGISNVKGELEGGNKDYGCLTEAIRIIEKGPNWMPGIQNNKAVKSYKKQRITFMVSEEK